MKLPSDTDILFVSNGHGEDTIAAAILDRLAPDREQRARIAAWPQVGTGQRYRDRGIATLGPEHHLPSEGFGTTSLPAFLRDLREGFVGTYARQARFARALRGNPQLMVAIGDIVPLMAGALSGMRTLFYSAPKSAHYGTGAGDDGHDRLDRYFMKRCETVLVRDALTAERLAGRGMPARFVGNPVMDAAAGAASLRPATGRVVVLLAGSRADALENTGILLAGLAAAATPEDGPLHGLVAAHDGFDPSVLRLPDGWSVTGETLSHRSGATAKIVKHRFADALASADIALGMAGTANEQAVGIGLPLIAVPGAGNQGPAFQRMKDRYFGAAARSVTADPGAIGATLDTLLADRDLCARMGAAGRALMGPPGGSAAIAALIAQAAGWEARP